MRLLVFVGTADALPKYSDAGWHVAVPDDYWDEHISWFRNTPDAKMATLDTFLAIGWRAPSDTLVLFDPSWPYYPDSAEWIQASWRV